MKLKVVLYHPVPQDVIDLLSHHFELTAFEKVDRSNREDFIAAARNADGLIGMGLPVRTNQLEGASRLKTIVTISAGYDSFDVEYLTEKKILLMNLFDPLTETTADLAFALLMATARRIPELDSKVRLGEWSHAVTSEWFGSDIFGKTLGIVGMGRIGAAIARRGALGCGMSILYTARTQKSDAEQKFGAVRCELDRLLIESDYVCLAIPLSEETTHLIGTRELAMMKRSAILVNIARGPVVDELALIEALQTGVIQAAGLDVFEKEPLPVTSPLLTMSNVVLVPHIGSATQETRDSMSRYAAQSIVNFLIHGKPRNAINPEVLSR